MSSLEDSPSQFVPENAWLLTDKEKEDLLSCICKKILNTFCSIKYHVDAPTNDTKQDQVLLYASEIFSLGLLYMEFLNAIREGDGTRIIHCY